MTEQQITELVADQVKNHGTENILHAIALGFVKVADEYDPRDRTAKHFMAVADAIDRVKHTEVEIRG